MKKSNPLRSKKAFTLLGVLAGAIVLTACTGTKDETVYRYKDTEILSDEFYVDKTVYAPGVMKLYYRGDDPDPKDVYCYGSDFVQFDEDYTYTFKKGVLTIEADFAQKISGLTIDDAYNGRILHLRYLDTGQFAWLTEELWLDDGWVETGDKESYYSAEELAAQKEEMQAKQEESAELYDLLEGTWVTEDGLDKLIFRKLEDDITPYVEDMYFDEESREWQSGGMAVESLYQEKDYDEEGEETGLIRIFLENSDHSARGMDVLYDPQNETIQVYGGEPTYYKETKE